MYDHADLDMLEMPVNVHLFEHNINRLNLQLPQQ